MRNHVTDWRLVPPACLSIFVQHITNRERSL
jgi:hypothetical protein